MVRHWTFRDYIGPTGQNEILDWLATLPKAAKAKINAHILRLELMAVLDRPPVGILGPPCSGLLELRVKAGNVQYRPLCCYGPGRREVTILFGAIEKGGAFVPPTACATARRRMADMAQEGQTCEHDFS